MKTYDISLVSNNVLNPSYTKASRFLVDKYQDTLSEADNITKYDIFKQLWAKEFDADLQNNKVSFKNHKKLTIFNLKFS